MTEPDTFLSVKVDVLDQSVSDIVIISKQTINLKISLQKGHKLTMSSGCNEKVLSGCVPYHGAIIRELRGSTIDCEYPLHIFMHTTYSESITAGIIPSRVFSMTGGSVAIFQMTIFPSQVHVALVTISNIANRRLYLTHQKST